VNKTIRILLTGICLAAPAALLAQQGQIPGMTDYETHLIRGMAQLGQGQPCCAHRGPDQY
jgi:hypothetical protein